MIYYYQTNQGVNMKPQVETMQKLLEGLYEEIDEQASIVRKGGVVSADFCDLCPRKRWEIVPLTPQQQITVEKLTEWAREFDIISIKRAEVYTTNLEIRSKIRIIKGSRTVPHENVFKYTWNINDTKSQIAKEIGKIRGLKTLIRRSSLEFCPHFNQNNNKAVRIKQIISPIGYSSDIYSMFIGCEECISLKKNTRCNSVYKDGFIYSFGCPFKDLLLKRRLDVMGLSYETGERERPNSLLYISGYDFPREQTYYFRDLDVLLNTGREEKETIKYLKPSLLVTLSPHTNLPDYLEYDIDVLFYDEDGFYLYEKETQVENEIAVICDRIISDLNKVMEGLRGNDHDRTISALNQIGASMGYVSKTEFSQPGVRIDLVWYDREGNIQVACEVETSSTWKKDLISTWEVEPRLAIIVGFAKTDRVAKNLMSITLMKYVPHPILYINKISDNAFLFEKNSIIKSYKLLSEDSRKSEEIKVI